MLCFVTFYRAMHYSAKRGIAIACRLSVRLFVTLVNQGPIGWKPRKLTGLAISPSHSLFVVQRSSTYSQGNMGKLFRSIEGLGESGVLEHKNDNISEMRKDRTQES